MQAQIRHRMLACGAPALYHVLAQCFQHETQTMAKSIGIRNEMIASWNDICFEISIVKDRTAVHCLAADQPYSHTQNSGFPCQVVLEPGQPAVRSGMQSGGTDTGRELERI